MIFKLKSIIFDASFMTFDAKFMIYTGTGLSIWAA